jgi:hypothetical protein
MSKKNANATIKDLKKINHVLKKVHEKPNRVEFKKIGNKSELVIFWLIDTSFKMDDKIISGILILLGNIRTGNVNPIFWKSKTIQKVCHLAKAAETRSMVKLLDDSQFYVSHLEQILFGNYNHKIFIKLFTDSKPMLESISSTHQVEECLLRNSITDMKDVLVGGQVKSFSWLDGERDMVANILTKDCGVSLDLEEIVLGNRFCLAFQEDNLVECRDREIKVFDKRNKIDQN